MPVSLNESTTLKRADSFFSELFRTLFEEIDVDKLKLEVESLRRGNVAFDPASHSRILIRRTALRCAATGAMSGTPLGLAAFATLGIDLAYLIYQQFRLVLGISIIYGHEPTGRERFTEALHCLAYGSGAGLGKQGLAALLRTASVEGGIVAEKIGTRFLRDGLSKAIPVIGVITGGALNYIAVQAVGRASIRFYQTRTAIPASDAPAPVDGEESSEICAL